MSVILVTDRFARVRATVRHLHAQEGFHRLELVIVTGSRQELELEDSELAGFAGVRVVELGELRGYGRGVAQGARSASAPIVALGETHSFPQPGWAEALLCRHAGPWAGVGPVVEGANPGRGAIARSNLLLDYGPWPPGTPGGSVDALPGHNSSYKRELLLGYGDELELMLEAEFLLHRDLRARGEQLYLEPSARTRHLQVSTLPTWLSERFAVGRVFSELRAREWSWPRRLLYLAAGPIVVPLRLRRILGALRRSGAWATEVPSVLPALVVGLVVQTAGEMAGLVIGAGQGPAHLWEVELKRTEHVSEAERAELLRAA